MSNFVVKLLSTSSDIKKKKIRRLVVKLFNETKQVVYNGCIPLTSYEFFITIIIKQLIRQMTINSKTLKQLTVKL